MSDRPRTVVLGAGPAGLGAALGLAERGLPVHVLERQGVVGGNAGSFEIDGIRVDYGSHRLHPAADPEVLERLRSLLGDDLLERPRHGRIRLRGRWIHFPLRALDLALRLPPRFALGATLDLLRRLLPVRATDAEETFASVLERGLGRTICRDFYFPYARRIWGIEPEEIDPEQAQRRVSSGSIGSLLWRLLPGGSGGGAPRGVFYYPRNGYGQISEALCAAALESGAKLSLETSVRSVRRAPGGGFEVEVEAAGSPRTLACEHVWSTIPVSALAQICDPPAPDEVLRGAKGLELRAMLLVYLVLGTDRFTEYDAHYFPGSDMPLTRLSEPKNYAGRREPRGRTVLCAELPCARSDAVWSRSDEDLGRLVAQALARSGLPEPEPITRVVVRRLPAAYPIYRRGFREHFDRVDEWVEEEPGLLSFGRQGLFAHDNTHHALYMARAAVDCLRDDGAFDSDRWQAYRRVFETHVVED